MRKNPHSLEIIEIPHTADEAIDDTSRSGKNPDLLCQIHKRHANSDISTYTTKLYPPNYLCIGDPMMKVMKSEN